MEFVLNLNLLPIIFSHIQMAKYKTLKVYSKYQRRKYGYARIPEIRLCGKWLKDLGFNIGDEITIEVYAKSVMISNQKKIT